MYNVYVLYSINFGRKYTGLTNNLDRRLKEHNSGQNKSTKAFVPWTLIYQEHFDNSIEARKREKYLKSGIGREFLKEIVNKLAP